MKRKKGDLISIKDVTWGDMGDFLESHGQVLSGYFVTALCERRWDAQTRLQEATFDWLTTEGRPLNPDYIIHHLTSEEIEVFSFPYIEYEERVEAQTDTAKGD